jgi:MYXO-CTERM domain-containing protein
LTLSAVAQAQNASTTTSTGAAPLVWKSRDRIFTDGASLGNDHIQLKVGFSLVPEVDVTKDVLRVDLSKGSLIEASWGDGKTFVLRPQGPGVGGPGAATRDGVLRAEYQLAPTIDLTVDAGRVLGKYSYTWNENDLINELLYGANFEYHSANQAQSDAWAWQGVKVTLPGAPLATSKLLSTTFSALDGNLQGQVAVNLSTTPAFTYTTSAIELDGQSPLQKAADQVSMPVTDADYLDIGARVTGQITYEGALEVLPNISVTEVLGYPLSYTFMIGDGADFPYGSAVAPGQPIAVQFPKSVFHIPLPNLKAAAKTLDLGSAAPGQELSAKLALTNSGEMDAAATFESSDPHFKVAKSATVGARGKHDVEVRFTPASAGPASAKITVKSNDPDQPVFEVHVTANGAESAAAANGDEPSGKGTADIARPGSDAGCGCVTAGATTTRASSGLGAIGLALAALVRRRRARGA